VNARILGKPDIKYANKKITVTDEGKWVLKCIQLKECPTMPPWGFSRIDDNPNRLKFGVEPAVESFMNEMRNLGIAVPDGKNQLSIGCRHLTERGRELKRVFKSCQQEGIKFLLIIQGTKLSLFNAIKRFGDIHYGIHTICVLGRSNKFLNKSGSKFQYHANVGLKVNLKLGGINHDFEPAKLGIISERKTMVFWVDVTHPSFESSKKAQNIATMVASIDQRLGVWPATLQIQQHDENKQSKEIIKNKGEMLKSRLDVWWGGKKTLPQNLLIYRDGVSEGQYSTVLEDEVKAMREVCKFSYPPGREPRMTVIIVGKRHHTRFYPKEDTHQHFVDHGQRMAQP